MSEVRQQTSADAVRPTQHAADREYESAHECNTKVYGTEKKWSGKKEASSHRRYIIRMSSSWGPVAENSAPPPLPGEL